MISKCMVQFCCVCCHYPYFCSVLFGVTFYSIAMAVFIYLAVPTPQLILFAVLAGSVPSCLVSLGLFFRIKELLCTQHFHQWVHAIWCKHVLTNNTNLELDHLILEMPPK